MEYRVGIYANDALLLDEVTDMFEVSYPNVMYTAYSGEDFAPEIASISDLSSADLNKVDEEDILIVLSDPGSGEGSDFEKIKGFDGSVVDFTGAFSGHHDDVYEVLDPVEYVLSMIDADKAGGMNVCIQLPAALLGKNGIEDLLAQTKGLFTFQNAENKVFDGRMAFNIYESTVGEGNFLSNYKKTIDEKFGVNASIRIIPVSTAFILDVFYAKKVKMDFSDPFTSMEMTDYIVDKLPAESIAVAKNTGLGKDTFFGDYIKGIVIQTKEHLKDILGE